MIDFSYDQENRDPSAIKIKVLGVGGAGGNTVNSMVESELQNVEFIVANTDCQALKYSRAVHKIQLGSKTTKGLGSGANPDLGRRATEEDIDDVLDLLKDADIVFIVAGMGGGTGSGGSPVIARALKERGILTISVVTKPFTFEGRRRMMIAEEALAELKKEVDTLIIVQNQKLLDVVDRSTSMIQAFSMINQLIIHSVKSISDIIVKPGHINVDFADLRAIMKGMGLAVMGTGTASGENRAQEAALQAISSSLLENMDIRRARGVLLNITGGPSLSLHEINDAANVIYDESDKNAHIILGSVIDENMGDEVTVSVVATGFSTGDELTETPQPVAMKTAVLHDRLAASTIIERSVEPLLQKVDLYEGEKSTPAVLRVEKVAVADTDTLDVPAFLRNKKLEMQEPEEAKTAHFYGEHDRRHDTTGA
jgi:cell division protein FtsZ